MASSARNTGFILLHMEPVRGNAYNQWESIKKGWERKKKIRLRERERVETEKVVGGRHGMRYRYPQLS